MILYFVQAIISWFLTGLIWTIQVAHYPIFSYLTNQPDSFRFHQKRMGLLVAPLMLIELLTAILLLIDQWHSFPYLVLSNFIIVCCIWLHTFSIMVPIHNKLLTDSNLGLVKKLVKQNWIRTFAWTMKSFLWAGIIWHMIST